MKRKTYGRQWPSENGSRKQKKKFLKGGKWGESLSKFVSGWTVCYQVPSLMKVVKRNFHLKKISVEKHKDIESEESIKKIQGREKSFPS